VLEGGDIGCLALGQELLWFREQPPCAACHIEGDLLPFQIESHGFQAIGAAFV
jgi:hypothetical protein